LERVTKAPASFDPKKLWAFQDHYMQALPVKQKVATMLTYLQRAGLVPKPSPCEVGPKLTRIVEAAGDRLKVFGDILAYADFFFQDEIAYDEQAFDKNLRKPGAAELLAKFRARLAEVEPFDTAHLEPLLHDFVAAEAIKTGDIIHAVRVAVTGKAVGAGLYDCLEILGKETCLARIDRALERAG
jgi:glutamyl-tRNA synthetase